MERRERHGRGTEARPSGSSQISMAILPLLLLTASKRVLVGQLWGIAFRARSWALSSDGRLVRDGQLSEVERAKLERWIAAYEWAVVGWLDGQDDDTALVLWREL